jgi:hypothetical protein
MHQAPPANVLGFPAFGLVVAHFQLERIVKTMMVMTVMKMLMLRISLFGQLGL